MTDAVAVARAREADGAGMPAGRSASSVALSWTEPVSPVRLRIGEGSVPRREAARACRLRALLLWPRLDRERLARTRGDPWRIARLVARRTPRPLDEIVAMLTRAAPACPVYTVGTSRSGLAEARPALAR
jgi:hypothetical protein